MAAAKKQCFFVISVFNLVFTSIIQSLALVLVHISSRHSNLNIAHQFVIYWLFQNGANKNQHQDSYQRETVPEKFVFLSKLVRQIKSIGWAKYVYVSEICAEGIFVTFPWLLKNVKSRSKIALFQMSAILKFDFQKRKQLRFFWSKLSKQHKKDPILHVATTFFLKQEETRTSHAPIPHPWRGYCTLYPQISMFCALSQNYQHFFGGKILYASYSILSKELKNGIEILVGQVFFKLWIKTVKMMFGSITQEPLGLPKFWCCFWVSSTIHYKMFILFFKKVLRILKWENMLIWSRRCSSSSSVRL